MSECEFNSLFGDSGHQGPYSPYKLCNCSLISWICHEENSTSLYKNSHLYIKGFPMFVRSQQSHTLLLPEESKSVFPKYYL